MTVNEAGGESCKLTLPPSGTQGHYTTKPLDLPPPVSGQVSTRAVACPRPLASLFHVSNQLCTTGEYFRRSVGDCLCRGGPPVVSLEENNEKMKEPVFPFCVTCDVKHVIRKCWQNTFTVGREVKFHFQQLLVRRRFY